MTLLADRRRILGLFVIVFIAAGGYAHVAQATALTVSCSPSPSSVSTGQSVTWTATVSGGIAPYTYTWSGTNSLTGSSRSVNKTYSSTGTKTATVTVKDSGTVGGEASYSGYYCTGSAVAGYPGISTQDAGPTLLEYYASHPFVDPDAPADVRANPQNYCSTGVKYTNQADGEPRYDYSGDLYNGTGLQLGNGSSYQAFLSIIKTNGTQQTVTKTCSPSVTVSAGTSKPDLVAGNTTPVTAAVGTAVTLKSTVSNNGSYTTGAGFYTLFQRATSSSGAGATDISPADYRSTALAAGGSFAASKSYTFTSAGTFYIRACADKSSAGNNGVIAEGDETNNCSAWRAITVSVGTSKPDLTAGSITPTSATPNTAVSLTANVQNQGDVSTGAGFYTLFQKATDASGSGATDIGTYQRTTSLSAGTSFNASKSYTFPSVGTYYIRACADKSSAGNNGVIAEGDETNNCGGWTAITVSAPGADLTAGSISLTPGNPKAGTAANLTATASNIGTQLSGSFPILFQIQDDTGSDVALKNSSYLAGLAAGASQPGSVSYTFTSGGTYNVRACANENTMRVNIVTETNYGNNCGPWKTVRVSGADTGGLSCTVSDATPAIGDTVTYTAVGGAPTDRYKWQPADGWSGANGVDTPTINRTFNTAGSYAMQVVDATGQNQTGYCPVVTAGAACTNPSATISANPTRVRSGETSTITWSASGVDDSCTVSGPGVSRTDTANSCTVAQDSALTPGITAQSVYTITCDGVQQDQVIVNVIPSFEEF